MRPNSPQDELASTGERVIADTAVRKAERHKLTK
jgi:hypothetical protein